MFGEQIRKIIRVGNSFAVTLPKDGYRYYERKNGKKITQVVVETNGKLTIQPILQEKIQNGK